MPRHTAVRVFIAFACAYFLSALIRAITATLSPVLTQDFALSARDLGLLAGGYFLGFAATQLPLGSWLDRFGPKNVILGFLSVAVVGCAAFAQATSFNGLLLARILSGIGVSACLMAPLTGYRRWFSAAAQLRSNSWMLMTGSMGMVTATLPVQWLMPMYGWRPLFWLLSLLLLLAMVLIAARVPAWEPCPPSALPAGRTSSPHGASYAEVWRHPYFRKMAPLAVFIYGGLVAIQTLWAAPWMIQVAGWSALQAASGMFWINVAMLCAFLTWGMISPWLTRRGYGADRLICYGMPYSFFILAIIIITGGAIGIWAGALFSLYCVSCTFVALTQPAVALAFAPTLAGRALSAYNLLIFSGVFMVQWGIGLIVDAVVMLGRTPVQAFQTAMSVYLLCCVLSYAYFLAAKSHNPA